MPIISIFFGYFFYKEKLSKKGFFSVFIVLVSILYLLSTNFENIPWVGLIVALSWSVYNLLKKKVLILDLDDTIWGCTIGDVGYEGIKIGYSDPESKSFLNFQKKGFFLYL